MFDYTTKFYDNNLVMSILSIFSKQKYTSALIGLGRIGFTLGHDKKREQPASHTMAFLDNKRINLVAGIDTDSKKAEEWKAFLTENKVEAETYLSSEEFYNSDFFAAAKPDIIAIAVNEASHLEECLKAIEAKPRILILEKPVALNSAEAEKIRAAAEQNQVPVMVNHERRFAEDYKKAKEFIAEIGDIQKVSASLYSGLRIYSPQFEEDGSYSLLHDGTHLVDIVRYLLDIELENPIMTSVYKEEIDGKADGKIVRNFTAHYSTDKIPEIEISMSGRSKFFAFEIEIVGTLGKICIGNGYAKFYLRKESSLYTGFYSLENAKIHVPKKTGYFSNMLQNAIDYLDGKAELISPLDEAIKDLKVLEEIKEKF